MAMLWAVANKLPATTFPIPACIPAAAVPDRVFQSVYAEKFSFYITGGVEEWVLWTLLTGDRTDCTKAKHAQDCGGNDRCQDDGDGCSANAHGQRERI